MLFIITNILNSIPFFIADLALSEPYSFKAVLDETLRQVNFKEFEHVNPKL